MGNARSVHCYLTVRAEVIVAGQHKSRPFGPVTRCPNRHHLGMSLLMTDRLAEVVANT